MDLNTVALSPSHDVNLHPEWMIKYGGKYYYNPALPEVQTHLMNIVDEVVTKYDIDAIHFDDYFIRIGLQEKILMIPRPTNNMAKA
jgi:uncharacterized lipoprotein YddW (UPF0748 family)